MDKKQKPLVFIVIGIVVLALVGLGGFWYMKSGGLTVGLPNISEEEVEALSPEAIEESLGAQILEQTQNPLKGRLPSTNPFEDAKTNPLEDVYQNPF